MMYMHLQMIFQERIEKKVYTKLRIWWQKFQITSQCSISLQVKQERKNLILK